MTTADGSVGILRAVGLDLDPASLLLVTMRIRRCCVGTTSCGCG